MNENIYLSSTYFMCLNFCLNVAIYFASNSFLSLAALLSYMKSSVNQPHKLSSYGMLLLTHKNEMPKKAFAKNTAEKNGFVAISKSKFWLSLYKVLKDWLHKPLRGSHFIYSIYTHAISCSHDWLCNILYFLEICSHTNTYHRQKKFEWNKKSTK